jgi:hypothetical protein
MPSGEIYVSLHKLHSSKLSQCSVRVTMLMHIPTSAARNMIAPEDLYHVSRVSHSEPLSVRSKRPATMCAGDGKGQLISMICKS